MPGRVSSATAGRLDRPRDPALPFLEPALDPVACEVLFARIPTLVAPSETLRVGAARLLRHKPGRRCLIEYRVEIEGPRGRKTAWLLGKARAGGIKPRVYRGQCVLWEEGFGSGAPDGVGVPEPLGVVPELSMWLQRRVPGRPSTALLPGPGGVRLARRVAEALHKLHRAVLPAGRVHLPANEIEILEQRLAPVRGGGSWAERVDRLLAGCARIAAALPITPPRTIHRDFYPDHAIVSGRRIALVDFDTLCLGDPALDAGNFIAHLIEQALRATGDPAALDDRAAAFIERTLDLDPDIHAARLEAWTTLALARHVGLSRSFPDRWSTTEPLLDLCERRLRKGDSP
jgi:hypothetical protein